MEITVKLKNIPRSPQKIRPILYIIRGKNATWALNALQFVNKASARDISQLLKSAIAAATDHEMKESDLIVKVAKCDQSQTIKRHMFKARGRTTRILKRSAHLTISLSDQLTVKKEKTKIESPEKKPIVKSEKAINKGNKE